MSDNVDSDARSRVVNDTLRSLGVDPELLARYGAKDTKKDVKGVLWSEYPLLRIVAITMIKSNIKDRQIVDTLQELNVALRQHPDVRALISMVQNLRVYKVYRIKELGSDWEAAFSFMREHADAFIAYQGQLARCAPTCLGVCRDAGQEEIGCPCGEYFDWKINTTAGVTTELLQTQLHKAFWTLNKNKYQVAFRAVFSTPGMRDALVQYGDILFMDGTFGVTKANHRLFFVIVLRPSGKVTVVGWFVVDTATKDSLQWCLANLFQAARQRPNGQIWTPAAIIIDCDQTERSAINIASYAVFGTHLPILHCVVHARRNLLEVLLASHPWLKMKKSGDKEPKKRGRPRKNLVPAREGGVTKSGGAGLSEAAAVAVLQSAGVSGAPGKRKRGRPRKNLQMEVETVVADMINQVIDVPAPEASAPEASAPEASAPEAPYQDVVAVLDEVEVRGYRKITMDALRALIGRPFQVVEVDDSHPDIRPFHEAYTTAVNKVGIAESALDTLRQKVDTCQTQIDRLQKYGIVDEEDVVVSETDDDEDSSLSNSRRPQRRIKVPSKYVGTVRTTRASKPAASETQVVFAPTPTSKRQLANAAKRDERKALAQQREVARLQIVVLEATKEHEKQFVIKEEAERLVEELKGMYEAKKQLVIERQNATHALLREIHTKALDALQHGVITVKTPVKQGAESADTDGQENDEGNPTDDDGDDDAEPVLSEEDLASPVDQPLRPRFVLAQGARQPRKARVRTRVHYHWKYHYIGDVFSAACTAAIRSTQYDAGTMYTANKELVDAIMDLAIGAATSLAPEKEDAADATASRTGKKTVVEYLQDRKKDMKRFNAVLAPPGVFEALAVQKNWHVTTNPIEGKISAFKRRFTNHVSQPSMSVTWLFHQLVRAAREEVVQEPVVEPLINEMCD